MNDEQLKDLAEWSRKFLADNTCYNLSSDMAESCLFHKWHIAPVLMHLAQVEMEKRGFEWASSYNSNQKRYFYTVVALDLSHKHKDHENEYIAFWTAVREALK